MSKTGEEGDSELYEAEDAEEEKRVKRMSVITGDKKSLAPASEGLNKLREALAEWSQRSPPRSRPLTVPAPPGCTTSLANAHSSNFSWLHSAALRPLARLSTIPHPVGLPERHIYLHV